MVAELKEVLWLRRKVSTGQLIGLSIVTAIAIGSFLTLLSFAMRDMPIALSEQEQDAFWKCKAERMLGDS